MPPLNGALTTRYSDRRAVAAEETPGIGAAIGSRACEPQLADSDGVTRFGFRVERPAQAMLRQPTTLLPRRADPQLVDVIVPREVEEELPFAALELRCHLLLESRTVDPPDMARNTDNDTVPLLVIDMLIDASLELAI